MCCLQHLATPARTFGFGVHSALGEMAAMRAALGLERLVDTDKRIIKGFHSVAREAADATENIQTEKVAHMRKNGCVFYVRT